MVVENCTYLEKEFKMKNSLPHVTLLVNPGYEPKHLGPMVLESKQADYMPTENKNIWISKYKSFIKISISALGWAHPQVIRLPCYLESCNQHSDLKQQMLSAVPSKLWSKHDTDVGFVKLAQPMDFKLKPGHRPPWRPQYPLKPDAGVGIEKTIQGLVEAGVLEAEPNPWSDTPILPVLKADKSKYRLVHDLRALNEAIEDCHSEVPNPHTLSTNVLTDAKWYTVIDLCSAFFSVPLSPLSRPNPNPNLFAFTYRNQSYTYTHMPQGFKHSPHVFNKVLKEDVAELSCKVTSTVIQYVDDIILSAPDLETCHKDSVTLLTMLAENGHKASLKQLQYC